MQVCGRKNIEKKLYEQAKMIIFCFSYEQAFQIQRHTKTEQMFPPKTPELPISKSITF